ncbi:MAG: type II secretion system protein [Planctomycetes bacterium]|nr:type II secretion system protein [Planctomycetota bacterium]
MKIHNNNGFTMLELTIVMALLTVLLYMLNSSLVISEREFEDQTTMLELSSTARRVVEEVAKELQESSMSQIVSILPINPGTTNNIIFKKNTGYNSGIIWSNNITYRLVMSDGEIQNNLDDNSDGRIDEQKIIREYLNDRIDYSPDVKYNTFKISRVGNKIKVEVTIEKLKGDRTYTFTASTNVIPKNN